MSWFGRANKQEVIETIEGWGPSDKVREYSETKLKVGNACFAEISHRQSPAPDGKVVIVIHPGTGLPEGLPGSQKEHLRIARANMVSFSVEE